MSSSATTDPADAAGGEAVFASDGLPSLAAPLPPPALPPIGATTSTTTTTSSADGDAAAADGDGPAGGGGGAKNEGVANDEGDAVIEQSTNVRAAFDAFRDHPTGWMGTARGDDESTPASSSRGWIDPRRRLFHLQSEVAALESTLAEEQARTVGDGAEGEALQAAAAELHARLAALGTGGAVGALLRGRQEDLTSVIARDVERFGEGGLEKGMEGLSLTEGAKTKGEGGKIVYELYRANDASLTTSATVPREVQLEERLRRLELAMGTTSSEGDKSISERLAEAERIAREADPKQIEKLAAKAKVIRADLEAAARARTKLASKSTASAKEDAKAIAELHAQLMDLEGISAHLPSLTVRLVELSALHANAAAFASRLEAAERAVARSEGTLASVEEAVAKVEGGWKENLEAVERNVKRLDGLVAKAGQS